MFRVIAHEPGADRPRGRLRNSAGTDSRAKRLRRDLLKGLPVEEDRTRRIYAYLSGPLNTVVEETEYEGLDLAEVPQEHARLVVVPERPSHRAASLTSGALWTCTIA